MANIMQVNITLSGMPQIQQNMQAWLANFRTEVDGRIQEAGINTQAGAKQACPVDTGRLRASIQYIPGILKCRVETNVNYAWFIENGHFTRNHKSFVAARPFLFPAWNREQKQCIDDLKMIA